MKTCSKCYKYKSLDEFDLRNGPGRKPTVTSWCTACLVAYRQERRPAARAQERRARLKKAYGMTEADYDGIFLRQGGTCAICGNPPEVERQSLCVDHDHTTGQVRGLLCGACNRGIGLLKDSSKILAQAYRYLETR